MADDSNGSTGSTELLDALTDYILEQLSGDAFIKWVHVEVGNALVGAQRITLSDVVTPQQVSGAAIKYALEWRIEGTIPELVGDIAARIHERTFTAEDEEVDFVSEQSFEAIAEKFMSNPAFQRVVDLLYHSPVVRSSVAWFLYRMAVDVLQRNRTYAERLPGLGMLVRVTESIGARVAPGVPDTLDKFAREFTERIVQGVISHVDTPNISDARDPIISAAMEMFEQHKTDSFSAINAVISADDIEDFLTLGFEFWREFRGTRSIRTAIEEGVGVFFAKYGQHTLADLLDEIGVTREDMIEEALRFAPRVIAVLQENGMLEDFIRRQFKDFSESERVHKLLR
ncbi:hypothetical protein ONR57_10480 [Hoyosella sp. YIM 151337]|uniref:hypothetical protein n=1 Tax=Hoyosella sp. YIM 151337 TaxID=2992742 RepID=UPI0022354BB1|nr:hypothetical protein [Hoyosella sp. YIM 151337]MCW4353722.1 hypothetical protein [Hoyosella sp. YIM 151337]